MSTNTNPQQPEPQRTPVENPLRMKDVVELLIKHYDLHEGKYELWLEFQMGFGAAGPNPESVLPGAFLGISRLGLTPSEADGPFAVDAAVVNPPKRRRSSRKTDPKE